MTQISYRVPMRQLLTFQLEGLTDELVELQSLDDAIHWTAIHPPDSYVMLGRGSNSLIRFPRDGLRVVRLTPNSIPIHREGNLVQLPAGGTMKKMQDVLIEMGLSGLEFGAGVPASVGGMVAMNFGCWGECMADRVTRIQLVQGGKVEWVPASDAHFGYRASRFHTTQEMVVSVELRLTPSDPLDIRQQVQRAIQRRLASQPLRAKTFGSIFKNPSGYFAAQLIEQAGLKGQRWGDIEVSGQHANFLVNHGMATYQETMAVIDHVRTVVKDVHGVELEMEVKQL